MGGQRGVVLEPGALRTARLVTGLSVAEAAAGIVSRQALHAYEKGDIRPSGPKLRLLAERYQCSLGLLVRASQPHVPGSVGSADPTSPARELMALVAQRLNLTPLEVVEMAACITAATIVTLERTTAIALG